MLTTQLTAALGIQSARSTNLIGRQRALSQRMAKAAFGLMWSHDSKSYAQQFDTARVQFNAALCELQRAAANSSLIAHNLELAEIEVRLFDTALGTHNDMPKLMAPRAINVAPTNQRLLALLDELTNQFAAVKA